MLKQDAGAQENTEAPTQEVPAVSPEAEKPEGQAAQPEAKEPEEKPETEAPAAFELKAPEGSAMDAAALESFSAYAKEQGFTQAQAQALLEREHAAQTSSAEAQKQAVEKQVNEWESLVKADPVIGGEALKESLARANRAIDAFATPEFAKELRDSPMSSHPGLIRFLVEAGKSIADDVAVRGGASAPTGNELRHADILYPSLRNKN